MDKKTRIARLILLLALLSFTGFTQTFPTPSKRQLQWQQLETNAFLHFTVNTFTNKEWGDGTESPAIFNPTKLDVRQWIKALKDGGFKMAIITAKHHDGFCLWPSQYTEHSIKNSPYKNGKGDIMEFYRVNDVPTILANVAWGTRQPSTAKWHTETIPLSNFLAIDQKWVEKFHIWKMDWNKDSINIYLDDRLLNTTLLNQTINADSSNPFLQPHFLLLNLAIGGNGGEPSKSATPVKYEIDYVRVYQKKL